jgi:hypothetical protein
MGFPTSGFSMKKKVFDYAAFFFTNLLGSQKGALVSIGHEKIFKGLEQIEFEGEQLLAEAAIRFHGRSGAEGKGLRANIEHRTSNIEH